MSRGFTAEVGMNPFAKLGTNNTYDVMKASAEHRAQADAGVAYDAI
jgi:hypothetical protein